MVDYVSTVAIDPPAPGVEVVSSTLLGDLPKRSDRDPRVHRDGYSANIVGVGRVLVSELDVTPGPVHDIKPILGQRLYDITTGEVRRRHGITA
jgi:hypothetical protein